MPAPVRRPTFDELNLSTGKRARLHRFMYEHGPANGTLMLLPIDQGLEHGPIDFFSNPESIDTDWIYRLAVAGNFSGMALHVGLRMIELVLRMRRRAPRRFPRPDAFVVEPAGLESRHEQLPFR